MKKIILYNRKSCFSIVTLIIVILASSCFKGGIALQSVTGTMSEVLVILDDSKWNSDAGETVRDVLAEEVEYLPNSEPMFDLSQVSYNTFSGGFFNAARNIIEIDISSKKYTRPKIEFKNNVWAQPQAYIKIQAPDDISAMNILTQYKFRIQEYYLKAEFKRSAKYFSSYPNNNFISTVDSMFHVRLSIPTSLIQHKKRPDFFWMYNGVATEQQNLILFSVPYNGPSMLDSVSLNHLCDSVAKRYLTGPTDSSYLINDYRLPMLYEATTYRGTYLATMRGIWRMHNDQMAGPYLRWARVDEKDRKLIIAQAFIYAPNKKKRNNLRQMEAVLSTWAFDYELVQDRKMKAKQDSIKRTKNK